MLRVFLVLIHSKHWTLEVLPSISKSGIQPTTLEGEKTAVLEVQENTDTLIYRNIVFKKNIICYHACNITVYLPLSYHCPCIVIDIVSTDSCPYALPTEPYIQIYGCTLCKCRMMISNSDLIPSSNFLNNLHCSHSQSLFAHTARKIYCFTEAPWTVTGNKPEMFQC